MINRNMQLFVVANQKGGVGKTTSAINLGSSLAGLGKKVLLIDLDPQSNLTSGIGYEKVHRSDWSKAAGSPYPSVYDVLTGKKKLSEVFVATQVKNLYLVPSHLSLAGAEIELVSQMARETILKKALDAFTEEFDYAFIDSPPSLGILTINALVAAHKAIVPIQCEYFALEGLGQLIETIQIVRNINPELEVAGVILTMFDGRTKLAARVVEEVRSFFNDIVFNTVIPRNVKLSEAPSHGKPIDLYDQSSTGADAYQKLAQEFVERFN